MKRFAIVFVTLLLCPTLLLAQTLTIAAGSTASEVVINPTRATFEKKTGIKLEIYKLPSKFGIAKLGSNEVQAVITDASLEDILAGIAKGNIVFSDPSRLKMFSLLKTSSIVVVNKANPVAALDKEQLKAIFTGKAAEWQAVGGSQVPIIVPVSDNNAGTLVEFAKKIMDNEALLADAVHFGNDKEVRDFVASTPEAIGVLSSMEMLDDSVKLVATPDIAKKISFYTVGEPAGDAKKLLTFLDGEGRNMFKK